MAARKPSIQPPDTLSEEDHTRLNDVRKELWKGGLRGLGFGGGLGLFAAGVARSLVPSLRHPKHMVMACLLGSAMGSYLSATTAGRRAVAEIGDIFGRGAAPRHTPYQEVTAVHAVDRSFELERRIAESHERRMHSIKEHRRRRLAGEVDSGSGGADGRPRW